MGQIDLIELSKRESERVEWKENVADIEDVIKTSVAFANDYSNLGGGYIICGAKEAKDEHGFQKLIQTGLTSKRLKEIEGKVLSDLRDKTFPSVVALTEEIPFTEEKRILVFIIPATSDAHTFSAIKDNLKVAEYASLISKYATGASLEEKEIERAVIALNKLRKSEEVIDYVKRIFIEKPSLVSNIVLLENKARATMDMAKICIDTGKNYQTSPHMKAKAWERARVYLDDAERDLKMAINNANSFEKEFINRDIEFLNRLKRIAQRPKRY